MKTIQNHVMRWVVTHLDSEGNRVIATARQGRYTHETEEEAQTVVDSILANNSIQTVRSLFGLPLEVRECKCYPIHFDPMEYYFFT